MSNLISVVYTFMYCKIAIQRFDSKSHFDISESTAHSDVHLLSSNIFILLHLEAFDLKLVNTNYVLNGVNSLWLGGLYFTLYLLNYVLLLIETDCVQNIKSNNI